MTTRRELMLGLAALVALQLVTSFSAIGLLTRTAPAVRQVLDANVTSLAAGEGVLGVLARAGGEVVPADERARAEAAVDVLRRNLTEPGEDAIVASIETELGAALDGDAGGGAVVSALLGLGKLNRAAMRRADAEMQRLGDAGAWFAVATAVGAFALSLLVGRRLQRRLLAPLQELGQVLEAAREGRGQRRCQPIPAAPDLRRILDGVNGVLDAGLDRGAEDEAGRHAERAALLHFLDARGGEVFVIDARGRVAAASTAGLAALAGEGGETLKERLAALSAAKSAPGASAAASPPGAVRLGEQGWLWERAK